MDGLRFIGATREGNVLGEFTSAVKAYRHEWRAGPYEAHWRFEAGDGLTVANLEHWFANRLMSQVRVQFEGREVWRGYIGKMTLNTYGQMEVKDVMEMRNAVKCSFQYTDINNITQTGWTNWFVNEASLAEYGSFEYALESNGEYTAILDSDGQPRRDEFTNAVITEPEDKAEVEAAKHSTPYSDWSEGDPDKDYLELTAYGAMRLADRILLSDGWFAYLIDVWPQNIDHITNADKLRQVSEASESYGLYSHGDEITVSNEIKRILDVIAYQADLYGGDPLLYALDIADNDRLTVAGVDKVTGCMTRLQELALLRDLSDDYYQLRIDLDGGVTYEKLTDGGDLILPPVYGLYPAPRGVQYIGGNGKPTWDARPEVMKIFKLGSSEHIPKTWLGDGRLRLHESVRMRDGATAAEFGKATFTKERFTRAVAANKRRLKRIKK